MALSQQNVTVTSSATQILTTSFASPYSIFTVIIQNNTASDIIYIGGTSAVSTSNGIKIAAGSSISLDNLVAGETIYGISSAASSVIQTLTIAR
jgi:hypothetical protein